MIIGFKGRVKKKIGDDVSFEDFVSHLKTLKIKINYENAEIIKKLKEIYSTFCKGNEYIKQDVFLKKIKKEFNFSHNFYTKEGMIERGYDENYIENFFKEHTLKIKKTRQNKIDNIKSSVYHYGKFSFQLDDKPKCKLCGSELNFGMRGNNELVILSCKNENCHSKDSNENKYKAFLPDSVFKKYKENRRKGSWTTIEYWTSRGYSEDEAKKEISKKQSSLSKRVKKRLKCDKEYIARKYGKEANIFFRKRSVWCIEYWTSRGYSEDEAKKKISEYQKEMSKRKNNKPINERKKTYIRCKEYWIEKGFSEEEAKEKVSDIQKTFTLEKCIDKYGEIEGYKRWNERQVKWQESLNKSGFHQLGHSKISQELFNKILEKYSEDDKDYIFYETKNKEYTLKNNNGFYYRFDFCDLKRRKFIEFNGDIYHANPKLYKKNDKPNPFHNKTAKEIWEIDEDKKNVAEKNNFKELVVWEKDYRNNKEKIINECIKFLFENE